MSSYRMTPRRGVTLLEVIVTIAILALVVGLLLSAVASVRMRATRADNENRLRQVTLAVHSYAEARSGNLPNVHGYAPDPGRTIFRTLAPYCEYQEGGIDAPALLRFPSDPSGQVITSGVTGVQADFRDTHPKRHDPSRVECGCQRPSLCARLQDAGVNS